MIDVQYYQVSLLMAGHCVKQEFSGRLIQM